MYRRAGIDVLIRIHTLTRLHELDRALLSLNNQSFSPVNPIVIGQNLPSAGLVLIEEILGKYKWGDGVRSPRVMNVESSEEVDMRSRLLNIGIANASAQFIAILDFDDYLYSDAYHYLTEEILNNHVAIAFGGIVVKHVRLFDNHVFSFARIKESFLEYGKSDLFKHNFCPIHSFVINRMVVSDSDLYFDEELTRLEDYEFLLRICTKYSAHFGSRDRAVGVYNWHVEGSKANFFHGHDDDRKLAEQREWEKAKAKIEVRKRQLRLLDKEASGQDLSKPSKSA